MPYQVTAQSLLAAIVLSILLGLGCRSNTHQQNKSDPTQARMETLAALYARYVGRHQGHLPPDETAFKNFISSEGKSLLAQKGISDVSGLFKSDRDGESLVVIYDTAGQHREFVPDLIVAHEKTGLAGKQLAAFASGTVKQLDPAEMDAAKSTN